MANNRFKTSSATLRVDAFMTHFIKVGGVAVIAAVMGIFVFIVSQILPLFSGAKITELQSLQLPDGQYIGVGSDEWCQMPFSLSASGQLTFVEAESGKIQTPKIQSLDENTKISFCMYKAKNKQLLLGSEDGQLGLVSVDYESKYQDKKRFLTPQVKLESWTPISEDKKEKVLNLDYANAGSQRLAAAILDAGKERQLVVLEFSQESGLLGDGEVSVSGRYDLSSSLKSNPEKVLVDSNAESVLVSSDSGDVYYFYKHEGKFELRQVFKPFEGMADFHVGSMNYVFGDVSIVFTNDKGEHRIFSLYIPKGGETRLFGWTKQMTALSSAATFFSASQRNKAYLIGSGSEAFLCFSTTQNIRWHQRLPFQIQNAFIGPKYNRLVFLSEDHKLHVYDLQDAHPEAGWKSFFGKIWYEGANEPKYEWQSTGGSDDFEPKFSMIPLIIGTLKGTFYAMLFALPIALIAAIYTSQFMQPKLARFIKPTMEIMASLPSVVLGFLSALWLAPLIEDKIPSVLVMFFALPLGAVLTGVVYEKLPYSVRTHLRPGFEFLWYMPVFLVLIILCWMSAPWLDKTFFAGDFRQWWPHVTGTRFEQRNSLAVGFMMGFAVIPLIFTIAEDSLSNVPAYLRSASLALGASRWQTALFVIVPTASAGIFSAIMIGLGRAIGETMIVVMATGNTPVMDMNIFSGMRTLSANIAVELPEAPHHSTLYRTLFLGALCLFMATFLVNTVAEVFRQRLREKYKAV